MQTVWVFLDLGAGLEIAVPHTTLHKLLHRGDPGSHRFLAAPTAGDHHGLAREEALAALQQIRG